MMVYVDLEFTQLRQDTTVISIGMVDENGRELYVEYNDFNRNLVDDWIQKNVIDNCKWIDKVGITYASNQGKNIYGYGDSLHNQKLIKEFLSYYKDKEIQFVSDVCHYDMVLLIDSIWGHAFKMPQNICAACYDINHDIARYKNISFKEAFDTSRESLLDSEIEGDKHNSLYDAKVIKAIYEKINK